MGCALSGPEEEPERASPDGKGSGMGDGSERANESGLGHGETKAEAVCSRLPLTLSVEQKDLVRQSWERLHQDIARVGIVLFIGLFETHPECKEVFFRFRDIELQQLKTRKELQSHGLRVMSFIEKSVARLGQEEKLEQLIFDLGRSHQRYNVDPKYYEFVGKEFIDAVKPILKEEWTTEVEGAWKCLFLYLTTMMKMGYEDEKERGGGKRVGDRHQLKVTSPTLTPPSPHKVRL
uniref:GbX2 n=1 Tax=Callorhinchus milii TaxID=7868 RepID=A0A0K1NW59_CALMI|nr:GbX2 [Callorhinchus milii]